MHNWREKYEDRFIYKARMRTMARMLELHRNDKIPDAQWAEVQSLSRNKTMKKEDQESYAGAQYVFMAPIAAMFYCNYDLMDRMYRKLTRSRLIAAFLSYFTATDLTEAEVLDLLFAVSQIVQSVGVY